MTAVPTPILEDMPGWDCATMGNGICGPGATASTSPFDGSLPLYMTPTPYIIGMVCLWLIGAVVLLLAPGARDQVGRGIWWVALGWPFTIPLGVVLCYLEWARRTRMGSTPTPMKWL